MERSSNSILDLLSTLGKPATHHEIAHSTGLRSAKSALSKLKKLGLLDNTSLNQWTLTSKGRKVVDSRSETRETEEPLSEKPAIATVDVDVEEIPVTLEDLFRQAGRKLFFTSAKGKNRLDAIVYYVGEMAGFDDPVKIWNALCDFRLASRVKYCWIEVFMIEADLGWHMPEEVREKCDWLEEHVYSN